MPSAKRIPMHSGHVPPAPEVTCPGCTFKEGREIGSNGMATFFMCPDTHCSWAWAVHRGTGVRLTSPHLRGRRVPVGQALEILQERVKVFECEELPAEEERRRQREEQDARTLAEASRPRVWGCSSYRGCPEAGVKKPDYRVACEACGERLAHVPERAERRGK